MLLSANFQTLRECTLAIGYGVVVDNSDVPFTGLAAGLYDFKLGDTVEPQLVAFQPKNGKSDVAPGNAVTFTFDEELVILSGQRVITLYEADDETEGAVAGFEISSPNVAVSFQAITVDLSKFTLANHMYSVELPQDAISDTSGNVFPGLPAGSYRFRTSGNAIIEAEAVAGLEQHFPLMMAGAGGLLLALAGLVLWRLCRLRSIQQVHLKPSSISPQTLPPGMPKLEEEDQSLNPPPSRAQDVPFCFGGSEIWIGKSKLK